MQTDSLLCGIIVGIAWNRSAAWIILPPFLSISFHTLDSASKIQILAVVLILSVDFDD